MIYLDELKDLKLYKKQFILPRNNNDKRHGNVAVLLTPNIDSSVKCIKSPLINAKYYESYYVEKDVSMFINENGYLDAYPEQEYVHESCEYVLEGLMHRGKRYNIIYNGYSNDVQEAKKYINADIIDDCNRHLKADIKYPISITIMRDPTKDEVIKPGMITMLSKDHFARYEYEYYCREIIYTMIINAKNPNINETLCDYLAMVFSGFYKDYKDQIAEENMRSNNVAILEYIQSLVDSDNWLAINKIIMKNALGKVTGNSFKVAMKNAIGEMVIVSEEGQLDPVKKLKRSIRYHANMGSKHIINKLDRIIDRTVDSHVKSPDFTTSDDPNLSSVKAPTVSDVVDKISATTGGNIDISTDAGKQKKKSDDSKLESYIDEEYKWYDDPNEEEYIGEDYIRSNNNILFFNEAAGKSNPMLYRILYKERLRKNKDVVVLYDKLKQDCPNIKYTFLSYRRYKARNLYIDLSFYNNAYFSNSTYKMKKGYDLYLELLTKMVATDPRLKEAGYTGNRTIIIPVNDWDLDPKTKMWIYTKDINPISIIYDLMKKNSYKLKDIFGDTNVVFLGDNGYFKINFAKDNSKALAKFPILIQKLRNKEIIQDDDIAKDSERAIVDTIIDNIEDSKNVQIYNLTGDNKKQKELQAYKSTNEPIPIEAPSKEKEIVDMVKQAAKDNNSVEDAIKDLDNDDWFKKMIASLSTEEESGPEINRTRQNRMNTLNEKILKNKVHGVTIQDLLDNKDQYSNKNLEPTKVPIKSINPEWNNLKYASFAHQYNIDSDIMAMFLSLSKMTYPISIISVDIKDTSTSEDFINTYIIKMENHDGKRFTVKLDIPIIINDQYMMLRGNKKVISTQSFLKPIIKTEKDTVQVISNYNKIFIRRFGSTIGKSHEIADRIIKTFRKNTFDKCTVNWAACDANNANYDLPIDYIDLSSAFSFIELPSSTICLDIKHMIKKFGDKVDFKRGVPYAYDKSGNIAYYANDGVTFSSRLFVYISERVAGFEEAFKATNPSSRYCYSKASILSSDIPLVIVAAYSEGLTKVLDKAHISYDFKEKKPSRINGDISQDYIKFSDGYLVYTNSYEASLLLNGLKECSTDLYSIADLNNKTTFLEMLDNYGGRLKADGIDNFYDCMIDPITQDVLSHYNLPTDYIEVLMYANALLADTKYHEHSDQSCRRFRKNEIIAGYTYKAIAAAYGSYATQIRHGRAMPLSIKQSAVIDAILLDPTAGDLSIINALNEYESYNQVSTKGLSGMNNDRSYSLDKRAYDDSMINVLSMSTGFAATVGINRQATLNANIETARGYIQPTSIKDSNSVNSLCMSEALTPMGTTRDDPFRSAMTFIQTTRHGMRVQHADPLLVTNGSDEALPYLISDTFAHKAKGKGEVKELVPNDYMIIQYDDPTKSSEFIDLSAKVEKNSSSGFYVDIKLTTDLKVGSKVKEGDIVAYDKASFDSGAGFDGNPSYMVGTLSKVALMDTDEGFEDSAIVSEALSKAMTSNIIKKKEINIPKSTNVYNLIKPGTPVEEGDTLMIMQSAFDDDDANILLKNLAGTDEEISDLGRIPIKSSVTGWIQDIEVTRTVELEELSESLQKICKQYESKIKKRKSIAKKYGVPDADRLGADYKLEATGRMKNAADGVLITIYMGYEDKYSIGDKLVYWSANKGVCKDIFPLGEEPYSLDRPNEKLHALVSIASANGRMVTSIQNIGIINRLLIEASRKAKDICGIEYDENLLQYNELNSIE